VKEEVIRIEATEDIRITVGEDFLMIGPIDSVEAIVAAVAAVLMIEILKEVTADSIEIMIAALIEAQIEGSNADQIAEALIATVETLAVVMAEISVEGIGIETEDNHLWHKILKNSGNYQLKKQLIGRDLNYCRVLFRRLSMNWLKVFRGLKSSETLSLEMNENTNDVVKSRKERIQSMEK
jgi:hypothetical protein